MRDVIKKMSQVKSIVPSLVWIEDSLPIDAIGKPKHGGMAYYLDDKLILILVEASRSYEYKGITYPFEIWNGCILPIESIKQGTVFIKFPFLTNHPASSKWLYLPQDTEDFNEHAKLVLRELNKKNPLFGLPMKIKTSVSEELIDTRSPKLFGDAPVKRLPLQKKAEAKNTANQKKAKKSKSGKKPENELILTLLKRRSR